MASSQEGLPEIWKSDTEFLQLISELSGLSIALWQTGKPLTNRSWTSLKVRNHPCFRQDQLRIALEEYTRSDRPCVFLETEQMIYGIMPIGPFSLVIGPAAIWSVSEASLKSYARDHQLDEPIPIPMKEPETIVRLMNLIHLHFTGTAVPGQEIPMTNPALENWQSVRDLEEYQLDQSENDRGHQAGVDYENHLMQTVQSGDVDALKTLMVGPGVDYSKIVQISDEHSKDYEYLIVSIISLCTRAAVAGGVGVEPAYQLGDVFLKRLSRAVLRNESFLLLGYRATIQFTELVKRSREERSRLSYVNECKDYIEKNLRKDLKVGDIAPAIGVSRTYLSRLFSQEEGITIQQYIQKEKCRHAAQMLKYSDHSIAQIALYLDFSSQSYFGSCFQTWYGMTPKAYRKSKR